MRLPTRGGFCVAFLSLLVLVLLLLFTPSTLAAPSFSDVPDTHPYSPAIYDLKARGIASGFADGTFRPNAQMTRQQFAKVIVKTLGLTVTGNETCPFSDVRPGLSPGDPFYPDKYIAVCAAAGIMTGTTASTFEPTGSWSTIGEILTSWGSYGRSPTPGASATVYFRGTRLDWIAVKGLTPGLADVYLDGVKQATIDLAAPVSTYQVNVWSTGTLPDDAHMVEIVRNSSSAPGKRLTLDALDIWGTLRTGP